MNAMPQSPLDGMPSVRSGSPERKTARWRETITACVTAGLATGPRSFTGLAAVVLATPAHSQRQPDRLLAHPAAKAVVGLLALQEWVMDKLPGTPSRLEPLGLATRFVGAGATGAILARRLQPAGAVEVPADDTAADETAAGRGITPAAAGEQTDQTAPADPDWTMIAVGASTSAAVALGVAVLGVRLRGAFADLLGQDWPAAALEDISSAGLGAAAVYLSTRSRSSALR